MDHGTPPLDVPPRADGARAQGPPVGRPDMGGRRNALLADMARDAEFERTEFLARAGEQLGRFMNTHESRIRDLGGLVLIDEDPDYLAIGADGSFRSRSRVYDEARGEWITETEVIESAAELVELYNPADILGA